MTRYHKCIHIPNPNAKQHGKMIRCGDRSSPNNSCWSQGNGVSGPCWHAPQWLPVDGWDLLVHGYVMNAVIPHSMDTPCQKKETCGHLSAPHKIQGRTQKVYFTTFCLSSQRDRRIYRALQEAVPARVAPQSKDEYTHTYIHTSIYKYM